VGCILSPLRGLGLCHVAGINNTQRQLLFTHFIHTLAHHFVHMLYACCSLLLWVDSVFVDLAAFHDEVYVLKGADVR
jgi:hypothetical protein